MLTKENLISVELGFWNLQVRFGDNIFTHSKNAEICDTRNRSRNRSEIRTEILSTDPSSYILSPKLLRPSFTGCVAFQRSIFYSSELKPLHNQDVSSRSSRVDLEPYDQPICNPKRSSSFRNKIILKSSNLLVKRDWFFFQEQDELRRVNTRVFVLDEITRSWNVHHNSSGSFPCWSGVLASAECYSMSPVTCYTAGACMFCVSV